MKHIARALVCLLIGAGALVVNDQVAQAWPYGCTATYNYGGTVGESHCAGGTGLHRSRLSCRDLTNGVVYYVYGPWTVTGTAKHSWAYCTSLGKPSYAYDAVGVSYQLKG
jgi:hypothetical protein